jgi:putative spermidine/putrescine transport system permease protein
VSALTLDLPGHGGMLRRLSDALMRHPHVFLLILLAPPLLWLGIVYVGSLSALLVQSFFSIDEFSGLVRREFTLKTYAELLQRANLDIIIRTVLMAAAVTAAAAVVAFPIAYYAARYAHGRWKALFYLAVMLPLWSSYLVRVYAWKLILAKEGILTWLLGKLHALWLLDAVLAVPVIGGPSLSISYIGTFLVFLYVWLPFMILPVQAALERVPRSLTEASADLGAAPFPDLPPCRSAARPSRHRGGLDLHFLPHHGRLYHPADRRLLALFHRPGGLRPPGHGR